MPRAQSEGGKVYARTWRLVHMRYRKVCCWNSEPILKNKPMPARGFAWQIQTTSVDLDCISKLRLCVAVTHADKD